MPWDSEGHELREEDKFCTMCGEEPIESCGKGHPIKQESDDYGRSMRPNFCHECGEA